jgi:hypothetical protein
VLLDPRQIGSRRPRAAAANISDLQSSHDQASLSFSRIR